MKSSSGLQIKGRFKIKSLIDGNVVYESPWQKNLVSEADGYGINKIITAMAGMGTSIAITKGKIGTGSTSATVSDTDLEEPVVDVEIADISLVDETTLLVQFFISSTFLPDDTYYEFGTFVGDDLFSRLILDTPYAKSGAVDTSIDYEFTIANA